jgi:hypothetical protein
VVVDWSAAATPKRGPDSIWIACLDMWDDVGPHLTNPPTRAAALGELRELLVGRAGRRVLVGVDVPLGCPAGLVGALGGAQWDDLWRLLAERLHDDDRNRNDRFEVAAELNGQLGPGPGPFWGCPPRRATPTLSTHKVHSVPSPTPAGELAELRLTERRLRAAGRRPFPVWQLLGVGSVGSQMLVGLPVLQQLRTDPELAARVRVWPFDTGCTTDPGAGVADPVVLAEVWPSLLPLDRTRHAVKDAAQVLGLADHLAALDRDGRLAEQFAPRLTEAERQVVLVEEGWILGVA